MTPIVVLLLASAALTVKAGPAMQYMQATAQSLHAPQSYVRNVLEAPVVTRPSKDSGS
jgi:multicomponent K+:H+ antiporter subunit D